MSGREQGPTDKRFGMGAKPLDKPGAISSAHGAWEIVDVRTSPNWHCRVQLSAVGLYINRLSLSTEARKQA
jgi:hypothetical protein